jgi:hypothetical protein
MAIVEIILLNAWFVMRGASHSVAVHRKFFATPLPLNVMAVPLISAGVNDEF